MSAERHPESVGIEEAARRLGVSPSTVRRRIMAGELGGAHRLPGRRADWRIPVEALVEPPSREVVLLAGRIDELTAALAAAQAERLLLQDELARARAAAERTAAERDEARVDAARFRAALELAREEAAELRAALDVIAEARAAAVRERAPVLTRVLRRP